MAHHSPPHTIPNRRYVAGRQSMLVSSAGAGTAVVVVVEFAASGASSLRVRITASHAPHFGAFVAMAPRASRTATLAFR